MSDRAVAVWAAERHVRLTPANEPMLRWYLRSSATPRRLGLLAGLVLPPLAGWSFGLPDPRRFPSWPWLFAGSLAGAVLGEMALVRRGDPARRTARLGRREVADHV